MQQSFNELQEPPVVDRIRTEIHTFIEHLSAGISIPGIPPCVECAIFE